MFHNSLLFAVLVVSGFFALLYPDTGAARQTSVFGSAGIGYDYWDRQYNEVDNESDVVIDQDAFDRRDYLIRAEIELETRGIHDSLSFRYAPVFRYDDLLYSTDVDHYLALTGERFITKEWVINLADNYANTNDPQRYTTPFADSGQAGEEVAIEDQSTETPDEITYNLGRRRFWTNDLLVETTYTYAEESDFGFGYTFRILRNDSVDDALADYDEYDRHQFRGLWGHMYNPSWKSNVDLRYIKGLYEDRELPEGADPEEVPLSQDLEEYGADIGLDYIRDVKDSFPVIYRLSGTKYKAEERSDSYFHAMSVGWIHAFDQQTSLNIAGGPSYADIEGLEGEWGYNAFLNFIKRYQKGSFNALASKLYEPRNFTGGGDSGLTDVTRVNIDVTYQFTSQLSSTLYGLYSYEDILDPGGVYYLSAVAGSDVQEEQNVGDVTYTRERYSLGASLDYIFLRWFTASISYTYYQQDADLAQDNYDDHRFIFQISASKELLRK